MLQHKNGLLYLCLQTKMREAWKNYRMQFLHRISAALNKQNTLYWSWLGNLGQVGSKSSWYFIYRDVMRPGTAAYITATLSPVRIAALLPDWNQTNAAAAAALAGFQVNEKNSVIETDVGLLFIVLSETCETTTLWSTYLVRCIFHSIFTSSYSCGLLYYLLLSQLFIVNEFKSSQ